MKTILYFSYGSNMSTPRLTHRAPSARAITGARLHGHRLMFHKKSSDNSGKCDIQHTNNDMDFVYGVVFEITVTEKAGLDRIEGVGIGYDEKNVAVHTHQGEILNVVTYYAINIDPELKPYEWYKEHIVRGACEHGLPAEYVNTITAIESMPDPDTSRHERELSIYRQHVQGRK